MSPAAMPHASGWSESDSDGERRDRDRDDDVGDHRHEHVALHLHVDLVQHLDRHALAGERRTDEVHELAPEGVAGEQ